MMFKPDCTAFAMIQPVRCLEATGMRIKRLMISLQRFWKKHK